MPISRRLNQQEAMSLKQRILYSDPDATYRTFCEMIQIVGKENDIYEEMSVSGGN